MATNENRERASKSNSVAVPTADEANPRPRCGRPPIDDSDGLRRMQWAFEAGLASSWWDAARIVAKEIGGHSYEATVWRLYKKFRLAGGEPYPSQIDIADEDYELL